MRVRRRAWRPRVLRMAILAIASVAVVKGTHLWQELGSAPALLASASRAVLPPAQAAGHGAAEPAKNAAPSAVPPAIPALAAPAEPVVNEAERSVLLDLRARRAQLDAREQTMTAREAVQAAAERRMTERLNELTALQTRLEQLDQTRRDRDDANWRGLVKTYETMRPRDAAAILNELETPVLLQVLDRMKEAKAAPVLAAMLPDRARAATAGLAQMRTRSVAPPSLGSPVLGSPG